MFLSVKLILFIAKPDLKNKLMQKMTKTFEYLFNCLKASKY